MALHIQAFYDISLFKWKTSQLHAKLNGNQNIVFTSLVDSTCLNNNFRFILFFVQLFKCLRIICCVFYRILNNIVTMDANKCCIFLAVLLTFCIANGMSLTNDYLWEWQLIHKVIIHLDYKTKIIWISLFFSFFSSVLSIRCYQCSTQTDVKGADSCGAYKRFNSSEHIAIECNSDESHMPGSFCMKVVQQGPRGFICKCISRWNEFWLNEIIKRRNNLKKMWKFTFRGWSLAACYP